MALKLQVLICTFGPRIARINLAGMPHLPGVAYLVSWQNPEGLAMPEACQALLDRGDVEIHEFKDKGIARNRNHALRAASAPYLLMSDDDVTYYPEGITMLLERFEADPELDFAAFRSTMPAPRVYPPDNYDLAKPMRNYYLTGFEMAFRRRSQAAENLFFSELAGIGAPRMVAGEEDLILFHAVDKGLKCRFLDFAVADHPWPTTCEKEARNEKMIFTKGVVIAVVRGYATALSRYPLEAARAPMPFFPALRQLLAAFSYAIKHRKEL